MGPIEDDDLPIVGHPVTWITHRARAFDSSFRPHRPPTHPSTEQLQSKSQNEVKHMMNVYAKMVSRAVVPDAKQ